MVLQHRKEAGECTPRDPHQRAYRSPDPVSLRTVIAQVDERGVIEVSEELMGYLLTELGWVEVEVPPWAKDIREAEPTVHQFGSEHAN